VKSKPNQALKLKSFKDLLVILFLMALVFLSTLISIMFAYSPGKIEPYSDVANKPIPASIAERKFIQIGGVLQGIFIRGRNIYKPVLLYVLGGPAFPNYFLIDKLNPGLEDYFTVCYWEQRGGGLSYNTEVTLESMNFTQLASDAIDITNSFRKRFGKEKIYIMAHSGGTPIALFAVQKEQGLYNAYIGMGQITNQAESEKIAYQFMIDKYTETANKKRITTLNKYRVFEADSNIATFYKSAIRDQYMHDLGIGSMHKMKSVFW
jgi:pimeloyl-ACP methyl ester carboxylesterase